MVKTNKDDVMAGRITTDTQEPKKRVITGFEAGTLEEFGTAPPVQYNLDFNAGLESPPNMDGSMSMTESKPMKRKKK